MNETFENPAINHARQIGLDVLKPSEAELQRGFELHDASLVIDSYGFSAFAGIDSEALCALLDENVGIDVFRRRQVDMLMTRMADHPQEAADFAEAWRAAGVTCVLRNSGEEGNAIAQLVERLAHNTYVTDRLPDVMVRATEPTHIEQAKREGKHCFYLTTNGVPLPLQFRNVAHEVSWIRIFAQLGVRMMHLTYNRRNPIGDGCAEVNDGGLSDLGIEVVREMNRCGVIVDGAHSSNQTCIDMAKASDVPVVVSHAICDAVRQHCRAKTDETIKAVADTGGYIGIACIPTFVGGSGDIHALLDHIDHAVQLVGPEHVTIGSDRACESRASQQGKAVEPPAPPPRRFENFWPTNDPYLDASQFRDERMVQSLAWTNFPLFTVGMAQRGYSDDAIAAILGGNVMRVAKAVWARRVV